MELRPAALLRYAVKIMADKLPMVRCDRCKVTAVLSARTAAGARHQADGGLWRLIPVDDAKSPVPNDMRKVARTIRDFRDTLDTGLPTRAELKTFLRDLMDKLDNLRDTLERDR